MARLRKPALGLAGLVASVIGATILVAPRTFYAGYGIEIPPDPSLLSELRAPGAGLAALGATMLAGVVRSAWMPAALVAALVVYVGFPTGRLVELVADGAPSAPILGALAIEIVIAASVVFAFAGSATASALRAEARSG